MTTGTKIILGVVITVLLIIGSVVGGLVGLYFYDDYEIKEKNKQAEVDGREFGKTTDQTGCMEKGFTIPDKEYETSTFNFIGECLASSRPTPGFCEGVPLLYDDLHDNKWDHEQCKKVGHDTTSCSIAFYEKKYLCVISNESKSK